MLERAEQMDALFNRCFTGGDNNPEFLYAVHRQHMQLHLRLAECTGCNALFHAIEKNQVLVFNWLFEIAARRPPLPPRFHWELMVAICGGDAEVADRAMRKHIRHGLDNIVESLSG